MRPVPLPRPVALALSLVAGVLQALNQLVFHLGSHWYAATTVALGFFSYLVVPAVLGEQFQATLLKLLPASARKYVEVVHGVIAGGISAVLLGLTLTHWDSGVKAAVVTVATVLIALGFGPLKAFNVPAPAAKPRAKPRAVRSRPAQ